ncbi:hypothetical protein D9M71_754470 [compost metagenome]
MHPAVPKSAKKTLGYSVPFGLVMVIVAQIPGAVSVVFAVVEVLVEIKRPVLRSISFEVSTATEAPILVRFVETVSS